MHSESLLRWKVSVIISVFLFPGILAQPLAVQNITIGGWIPDSPANFLMKFRPLFEDYLNNVVGTYLDPPAQFSLIPAEYTAETSFENLLSAGRLDFMCKSACT